MRGYTVYRFVLYLATLTAMVIAPTSTAAHASVGARDTQAVRTITVKPGDTYGQWASTYCGSFSAWPKLQAVNGWPANRIPVGAKATIDCQGFTSNKPAVNPSQGDWVHPLASGRKGNSCYRTRARPSHGGVDMAQPSGTTIRSVTDGVVYRKGYESRGAGNYVVVKHAGNVYSHYFHLRVRSPLSVGVHVDAGQSVGQVGRTGNATGNHLHFEIRVGGASGSHRVDPAKFLRTKGIDLGC